jgi:hypothetical protein
MTVFVLGAGASVHAGYPLASELGEEMYSWAGQNSQTVGHLTGFIESLRELYGSLSDFERILTELTECPAGSPAEALGTQRGNTRGAIEALIPEFFWSKSQEKIDRDYYGDLARYHVREGDVFVTFNYDLACERALKTADLWEISDGYGFDVLLGQLPTAKVKVLKLHGSINWLGVLFGGNAGFSQVSSAYGPRPCLFGSRYFSFLGYPPEIHDPLCQGISRPGGEPALILPGLHKSFFHQTFAGREWQPFWDHIWDMAGEAVRSADEIVVIGYSMPEADERARELLLKCSNPEAEILVFSGNSTHKICEEFREKGFGKTGSDEPRRFEDYLKF